MPVPTGFGVNYNAAQANWTKDMAYFKAIGVNIIRVSHAVFPDSWVAGNSSVVGSPAWQRLCAQTFHNAGFYVIWGAGILSSVNVFETGLLNSTNWVNYHDWVVAEATYLQAHGIVIDEFCIGNEVEGYNDGTTLTQLQLQANLRQLATDVKAVYSLGKVTYATFNRGNTCYSNWIANGKGNLDTISIHPYGVYVSPTNVDITNFTNSDISNWVTAFGANGYVSEFNLDSGAPSTALVNSAYAVSRMATIYAAIRATGVSKALLFQWVGQYNTSNSWAQLYTNGSMNPMWFDFFTSQPMFYTPRAASVSRATTPNRAATPSRAAAPTRNLIFS